LSDYKSVGSMLTKKVKLHYYTYKDKSIIFTPLVHFGQKEFYLVAMPS